MLAPCAVCEASIVDTECVGPDGMSVCDDCREDMCDECGGSLADGEGYDGYCGECADTFEMQGRWS